MTRIKSKNQRLSAFYFFRNWKIGQSDPLDNHPQPDTIPRGQEETIDEPI
jgi:hypothetical protein